jgi:hypothetical protein
MSVFTRSSSDSSSAGSGFFFAPLPIQLDIIYVMPTISNDNGIAEGLPVMSVLIRC